jgi:DNA-binding NtrC family response regulator
LNSKNGTFYLGQRVQALSLSLGSELRVGETTLRVVADREDFEGTQGVAPDHYGSLWGSSAPMRRLFTLMRRLEGSLVNVLVQGESGTGKELIARALHEHSQVKTGPFVALNCGALDRSLVRSELFGHKKGAFTGAQTEGSGAFADAEGGTLFLDEIGEMPLSMQAHLLRVLEERRIRPVGANRELPVDVRIIAASNRDLATEVEQGRFREDLYYRLNILSIRMPALRERLEDLPILARYFVESQATELGVPAPQMDEAELARLKTYPWPGNVRELKNVLERSLLLNTAPSQCLTGTMVTPASVMTSNEATDLSLEQVEKQHILHVLKQEGHNKSAAARQLGISRKTLERKLQAWDTA